MKSHAKRLRIPLLMLFVVLCSASAWPQHYKQTNLVSDVPNLAAVTDPDLVNAWGLARSATSPWWVNDNGTGKSTLYNSSGAKQGLVVTIPPTDSAPTGMVFAAGAGFPVTNGATTANSLFIFATEDGVISGWNPSVNPTSAETAVDATGSAVYKGLALATMNGSPTLYAANFLTGKVDVFDSTWHSINVPGGFIDQNLPAGYGAFSIHNIGGSLYVAFAKQSGGTDEIDGRGLGFVDKFDSSGNLLMRIQHGPWMDAPWGVALAPANFGVFSNDLLVGNFGSGNIAAFNATTGEFVGYLHGAKGPIVIDGLWDLAFGGGSPNNGPVNTLFFSAGIDDEAHGLFGTLTSVH